MTTLLIRHLCNGCGESSELTTKNEIDRHTGNEVLLRMVEPCAKCLRAQAEDMVEAIEEAIKDHKYILKPDDYPYDSGIVKGIAEAIKIIKERGKL